jgi:hypothetical protein
VKAARLHRYDENLQVKRSEKSMPGKNARPFDSNRLRKQASQPAYGLLLDVRQDVEVGIQRQRNLGVAKIS